MIDNALDFEGLKYYDGKNKDYIQEQIDELIDSLPDSIREYSHKATAASTTALDELTGAGIWYEYNKVCTGVPTELENTTIIALIKNETVVNLTIQTLTTVSNGVISSWQRRYSSTGTWGGWEKVATGADLSKKVGIAAQYTTITPTGSINDVLDIDKTDPYAEKNQPKKVYQMSTDTTAIANMPDAYPVGKGFVGMRFVHYFSSTNIQVELLCFGSGRRWFNNYVTDTWQGWECDSYDANGNTLSGLKSKLDIIGAFTSKILVDAGISDNTKVWATICMQKLSSTKCNIYISYKISSNVETDKTKYYFMSTEKIRTALGLKTLTAGASQSQVTFNPSFDVNPDTGDLTIVSVESAAGIMGYTGVKASIDATGIQMGRIYNDTGSYGSWDIATFSDSLFKTGTYGQINFYSASYSV